MYTDGDNGITELSRVYRIELGAEGWYTPTGVVHASVGIYGMFSRNNDLSNNNPAQRQGAIDYIKRELEVCFRN